jgi:hypothetical protein
MIVEIRIWYDSGTLIAEKEFPDATHKKWKNLIKCIITFLWRNTI